MAMPSPATGTPRSFIVEPGQCWAMVHDAKRASHPGPELRHFYEEGLAGVGNLVSLPVPTGMALHVCLLRYTGALMNTRIDFDNAFHLATIDDGPDWQLEVMTVSEPWTQMWRDWADEKRGVPPGSHDRSAVNPDFNRASPSALLTKLVTMEDGSKRFYDLAALEPES
jgi:hypothetical protein